MQAKSFEKMSRAELIEIIRARDETLAAQQRIAQQLAKDIRERDMQLHEIEQVLDRVTSERNNYARHFNDLMEVTKAVAQKVSES